MIITPIGGIIIFLIIYVIKYFFFHIIFFKLIIFFYTPQLILNIIHNITIILHALTFPYYYDTILSLNISNIII